MTFYSQKSKTNVMNQTKKYEQDFTQGPLAKQILLFSIPLMFTNVLQILFNMADIAVVGRFAGTIALGSVGSTATLVSLFTGLLIGVASGVNVVVAHHLGAKNPTAVKETVHTAAIMSTAIGLLVMTFGLIFTRPILELMNTKPELIDGATSYLTIYFCGMPALALFNYGNAVLSAAGDTKRPLKYLTISGVINVILNLFFVIVCHLDVKGVALASIISQYVSAFLILRVLFTCKEPYGIQFKNLYIRKDKLVSLLRISIPSGFQNAIFFVANLFVQVGVNSFSATYVSANSAAANADGLVYDVMAAFYTACGSFIGQNYGAGKKKRILHSYLISLGYSFFIGTAMGLTIWYLGEAFLSLFTTDAAVVEAGMIRLTIMSFSYGFSAFMDSAIAASRGLGKGLVPTIIIIMGSCVFRIVWIYTIFAYFGTITSLYLLYIFSWSITAIAEIIYFVYVYKKELKNL